ncbi:MAG: aminotransferase class I/II-fold pyridoxal phosphate-dependent enzyme, partial [Thermoproteales archaeon]|nr:aminotransferase class I/II-fold pyridoxal phosphate-dependent enzyme [Thermoproteales archaeon]
MRDISSLSKNASKLKPEEAFIYLAKAMELKRKGVDVISFGIGQPDFQPPSHVIEAAKRALDMGYSGYGPSLGLPELREAIKDFVNESYGTDIKKEEVMVTVGAKTAVFMGLIALIDQGDEVLIPDPGYPLYESAVLFAGGKPVFVKLREDEDYRMDPKMIEDAVTSRTRVIILNYPENPAGSTLSKNDVLEIMEIAKRNNIVVFSDEIYDRYVYDGEHFSTLQYDEWRSNLYYVNGFSKTFAMTGWR